MELHNSEELLRNTIDSSMDMIQVFKAVRNTGGEIIDFVWILNNKTSERIYGDVIGKSLLTLNPGVIEEGIFDTFKKVVETGEPDQSIRHYVHEQFNGWFYQSTVKLDDGVATTTRDITEQKKAEQEILQLKDEIAQRAEDYYRTLFNSIDEGFCIYELVYDKTGSPVDLSWIDVNPAYEKQTGLKDVIGKTHRELSMATEKYLLDIYNQVLITGKTSRFENWHEPTGRCYRVSASPIRIAGNKQVAVVFEDITERKHREEHQEFILKLTDAVRRIQDPVEIQNIAMRLIAEKLNVERAGYYELDDDEDNFTVTARYDRSSVPLPPRGKLSGFDPELLKKYRAGEIVTLNDSEELQSETLRDAYRAVAIRSWALAPLVKNGHLLTAIGIQSSVPRNWKRTELKILEDVAERTWAAVERARAQEALAKSEAKYRSIFEIIDEGFTVQELITNESGNVADIVYREANEAFEHHTGIKNIVSKKASEIFPHLEQHWLDAMTQVYKTGKPLRIEGYQADLDRWITLQYARISGPGSKLLSVVFQDITKRKRREANQTFLVELTDDLQRLTQPDEITHAIGERVGQFLDLSSCLFVDVDNARGEVTVHYGWEKEGGPALKQQTFRLSNYLTEEFARACRARETTVIRNTSNDPRTNAEAYAQIKVGAYVVVPFHREGRWVAHLVLLNEAPRDWREDEIELGKNIADRVFPRIERARAEEALRKNEQQLKGLLKQRDEFIGIASHELKTPVTSMKAYAEIVQERMDESGNENDCKLLSRMNTQIDRLTSLINNLLDTTRISEGQLKLDIEELDLDKLLKERIEEIKRTTNHIFELYTESLSIVRADKERIGQVITNLLSNAIKYSPKGTTITVNIQKEPSGVKISVQDEGLGIPEADVKRIFDRFYRVTANHMDTYSGMGLGLYITAQIIHKHKGTISVQSKEGKGSIFSFTLPYNI